LKRADVQYVYRFASRALEFEALTLPLPQTVEIDDPDVPSQQQLSIYSI
jgi:hypothetical protein